MDFARRRAECVVRLCGTQALIHQSDLIAAELNALRTKEKLEKGYVQNNDSWWMPNMSAEDIELPSITDLMREGSSGLPLSSAAWNKYDQMVFGPDGSIRPEVMIHIQTMVPAVIKELQAKLPLNGSTAAAIRDYFLGRRTKFEVQEMIAYAVGNVRHFLLWFSADWDEVEPLTKWVRESGARHADRTAEQRKAIEKLFEMQRSAGDDDEQIHAKARREMFRMRGSMIQSIAGGQFMESTPICEKDAMDFMPGITTAAYLLLGIVERTMTPLSTPRRATPSDLPDAIHSVYLPYVDIFRADDFVVSVLRSLDLPFDTTVVGKLEDIPTAIEKRIQFADAAAV